MSAPVLSLIFFFNFALAQEPPSINYITNTQTKNLKDTVILTCAAQDLGDDHSILWMKVDKGDEDHSIAISEGDKLILLDPRFSITYDRNRSISQIKITDVREEDAGHYECQIVSSSFKKLSAEVELHVLLPPSIINNTTRSILVSEGEQDVQIECYAEGFPTPSITWERENNKIMPTGGQRYRGNVLKIKQIRKEDRGTYFCVAYNGIGKIKKRAIDLHVASAPVVVVPKQRLGQALKFDMNLECQVDAYPPPVITWEKVNTTLSTNQNYKISHFSLSDEQFVTTLRVISIGPEQYGEYVCKATNKLGKAEGKIELFEDPIPSRTNTSVPEST